MGTDRETIYKQTMEQTRQRKLQMTRRQMLQATAATAAAAAASSLGTRAAHADTKGPGWYTDDKLTGKVTMMVSAGQRWELPSRGVLPIFNERFPNIEVDIQAGPHSEMVTKGMMLASSKSSTMDVLYTDFGQCRRSRRPAPWSRCNASPIRTQVGSTIIRTTCRRASPGLPRAGQARRHALRPDPGRQR